MEGEREDMKGGGRKQAEKEEKGEEGGRERGQAGGSRQTDGQMTLADGQQEYKPRWKLFISKRRDYGC